MYTNAAYWLVWLLVTAPLFGGVCALLAKELGRRPWPWFGLGFFLNVNAVLLLAILSVYQNAVRKMR